MGPWESLAAADEEAWEIAWEALRSHVHGAFGYLRGTTGDDPTPTTHHRRLHAVPCDTEGVLNIHLAIDEAVLAAGRLTNFTLAWVDFDGG